jgi:tripartite-type tricarboxylate transporter receptor subunit TctC
LHVPYQGIAASLINMIGGNIDYMITTLASVGGQIKSGQVRPIAVTSLEKSKFLPDVPPAAQLMPGYEVDVWWVVFAPAKTPDAIVNRLNQAIRDVSQDADMQELFAKEGAEPMPYSPAQTAAYVKAEVEKLGNRVGKIGSSCRVVKIRKWGFHALKFGEETVRDFSLSHAK